MGVGRVHVRGRPLVPTNLGLALPIALIEWLLGPVVRKGAEVRIKGAPDRESHTGGRLVSPACRKKKKKRKSLEQALVTQI